MSYRFTVLETSLNRAEFQWKCLRLLQRLAVLGLAVCAILFALGLAIFFGWLSDKKSAIAILAILGGLTLIAFLVVLIATSASTPERTWLATEVERNEGRFLDRLSALLHLETRRGQRSSDSFAYRIARQAQQLVTNRPPSAPFSAIAPVSWFCAFLLAGLALLYLNDVYAPWDRLVSRFVARTPIKTPEKPLELAAPATNSVETHKPWGEVRITDPGTDLKVTKVDVVPLQIEAAANQALQQIRWLSAVNGGDETPHQLPPPAEPRYAIYQPTLYLDELNLADWDVLTYYAQASTASNQTYASEIYFVEVRPFREDIMKMPGGGESGKPYQTLSEITGLINRQQHVIRETYQHVQAPPANEAVRGQDRKKLAEAEQDLSGSSQHLYAKMATQMENLPIGDALDNLAKAQNELESASGRLQTNEMPAAQNDERAALSSLVAARKMFQKAVTDNPGAFDQQPSQDEEQTPVADSATKLQRMAEFRNEARAAQEFLNKKLEQQKDIAQRSRSAPLSQYSPLSTEEKQLQQELRNFSEQHPQAVKGAEAEAARAQATLNEAAEALQQRTPDARGATDKATQALERLAQSTQRQFLNQQLADAYKLKQMLEQEAQALERRSRADSDISDEEMKRLAREAGETVDQLKKMAESEPTKNAFGQPLREALGGNTKTELDANLQKLQRAEDESAKQQASAAAAKGLGQLSKAFDNSQPKSLQMAQQNDSLKTPEGDSFAKGMAELDSLLKQLQDNRQLPNQSQSKQAQQALSHLQRGLRSQFGDNQQGTELLGRLEQALKEEAGLEPGNLKQLMEALQKFSVEASDKLDRKDDQPQVANINPSRLPPAYRGRIQKYFEKLSEK